MTAFNENKNLHQLYVWIDGNRCWVNKKIKTYWMAHYISACAFEHSFARDR